MDCGALDAIQMVERLGKVTWAQARYSTCFNTLVEEFDQEKEKLDANIVDMEKKVEKSLESTAEVGSRYGLELKSAKDLIREVDELQKQVEVKKTYCYGHCPDLYWQDRLGRKVANKTAAMKTLNAQFQPQQMLSHTQSLIGMEYYSSGNFIPFESRVKAWNDILKALEDPNIHRIGLYGMGGCGKTTFVKEMGKEAEKLFKKVVFVTVSSSSEVRNVQHSIADQLNLTLKEGNEPERARRLYMRLSGREKILIILDDVWEELDFKSIGIPCDDNHKGCKILLTTRHRGVCASLKCREFSLGLLSEEEAWQLFQKHAEINEDISKKSLKGLPRVINRACKGLPIAVAAFAKALKEKDLDDWKDTYDLLKRFQQVDIENKFEDPYESLKFSYDRLKEKETKDLFLLCSLFPEDSKINKEDLIRMATGLGLFDNVSSCNDARREGRRAIGKLLDSFLLLQAEEGMSVMLHDILRAVALRIAGKQIQTITELTMPPSLMEPPEHVAAEEIEKLYCHCMNEFPLQFKCPKLEILIVCKDGKCSPEVPDEFFNDMVGLKVLTIIDKSLWQNSTLMMPKSIWSLTCLRTLCIRGCRLDFKFSLQQLENLKILEFCDCSILQLPNDIAKLNKLRLLDVSRCRVRGNPYKVLGSCVRLEELYFSEIELQEELLKDQNLAGFFDQHDYITKLERYNLQIGARVEKKKDGLKSGFLSIHPYSDQDTSTSSPAIMALAQRAVVLFLENIPRSCENVIPHIVYNEGGCMNDLIELLLCNSEGIKYLIDTTLQLNQKETVLSNLLKLRITGMECFEGFCNGEPPCRLFEQLKELECSQLPVLSSLGKPKLCNLLILKLESCPTLESLFAPAVAVSLEQLKELKINKCHALMCIIGDSDIIDDNNQKTYGSVFKKLKELVVGDCSKLEYLVPLSFAWGLENLEVLKIYLSPNLKYAFGKYDCTRQLCDRNQNETQIINLSILKVLELINLDEIISMFPENYDVKFPYVLESHIVDNCPHLKVMKSTNSPKVDSEVEVQVRALQHDYPPRKAKLFFKPLGTSIVAENMKEWVYAPILRQAQYLLSFNRYVEDLRTEIETLKFTTASLHDRAKGETSELDSDVTGWLVNADALIKGAEKLEEKAIANKGCCFGHFPNWFQRYRIGKQAAGKINSLIEHNRNREFQKFSRSASLTVDCFQEDFIFFDSRKSLYYSLLESIEEDEISLIGLHGTGGCGKSTLAKQVAKEAEQLFDRVIFVAVSSNLDVQMIQEKIARSLDWKPMRLAKFGRAKSLFRRLSSGERILIILDNVQDRLNLEDIGIPFGVNHKGCNVLIITRSKQVCIMMDCQRTFPLLPLRDEEAWFLVQRHAHITEDTNGSLKDVAKEVIQGCEGLPVVIAAVASTLKGKTEGDWKEALEMLQSSMDNEVDLGGIYKCFKASYHNLADENAKSLLLLCSLFPEDFEIDEEHLMRYGILLGLFGESSYARARDQVREAKEKLIDSCLLVKEDEGQCVKMHGLVRDAALSIANKEIVTLDGIQEWQSGNTETIRYLWCENANKLPNELYFPKLEFLYLGVLENPVLPDEFFKGMKFLKLLVLRRNSYYPEQNLNGTILSVPNLVGLFLEGWNLGDIFSVVRLHRLEALILQNCSFNEVPNEITELRKLRLLELSNCMIRRNSYQAIGRCSQLQELYFTGNFPSYWNYRGENGDTFFLENEICQKLERYHIGIGDHFGVFQRGDFSTSRGLSLEDFDASTSTTAVKSLVQRAEVLSLGNISGGCENIIPDMVQKIGEGINELIELHLWLSDEIKCITDTTAHVGAFFPCLTKLEIDRLKHMEALFSGPIPAGSFAKLKELRLSNCQSLKSLFTVAEAEEEIIAIDDKQNSILAFPNLEELDVCHCKRLEYLGGQWLLNLCSLKVVNVADCSNLKSLFTPLTAKTMTSLEKLSLQRCDSLKEAFGVPYGKDDQPLMLPRLKMLRLTNLQNFIEVSQGFKLEHVITAEVDDCPKFRRPVIGFQNSSQGQNPDVTVGAFFTRLTKLRIRGLHGTEHWLYDPTPASSFEKLKKLEFCEFPLESLFTVAIAQSLEMLQVLRIIQCGRLKHIIRYADGDSKEETFTTNDDQQSVLAFPKLQKLYVEECEELEYLGEHWLLNLSSLNVLSVNCCPSLESLFTTSTVKTMTSLEELCITKCVSLKKIFGVPYSEDSLAIMLPQLKKLTLKELPNLIQVSHEFKLQRVINVEVYNHLAMYPMSTVGFQSSFQHENPDEITFITDTTDHVRAFFPWITKLKIRSLHSMESLRCGPTPAKSFEKLKELELSECRPLKFLFTVAVVQSLEMLQILRIFYCDTLKHVVWDGDGEAEKKIITTDDDQKWLINFCSLKVLEVKNCSSLKSLFTPSIAKTMISLERLFIERCTSLKEVFGVPYREDIQALTLPSLKILRFIQLPNLIGVSRGFKLHHAIDAEVDDCPKFRVQGDGFQNLSQGQKSDELKCITDSTVQVGTFFRLAKLRIRRSLGTKGWLCGPIPSSSFEKLQELEFCECPSVKSLFTVVVAQSLEMLQVLKIIKCDRLKHIIRDADGDSMAEIFTIDDDQKSVSAFPKLEKLHVEQCGELEYLGGHWLLNPLGLKVLEVSCCSRLKSMFTESTAKMMTSLEELFIGKCDSLKEIFGVNVMLPMGLRVPNGEASQALMLPRLQNLILIQLPNLIEVPHWFDLHRTINVEVYGGPPMFCFGNSFQCQNPDKITFRTDTTERVRAFFPWITKLAICSLFSMESLCCGPTPATSFEKLKELELNHCQPLKSLFTVAVVQGLEMLQVLRIFYCDTLKHVVWDGDGEAKKKIITTDDDQKRLINFCSLKVLEVKNCSSLKSLFTPSIAKTMVSLKTLCIERCTSLKEVFGVPYGKDVQALTLPSLKMLRLIELPKLIGVSRGFKLQHAIDAEVDDCPKFRVLVDGYQNLSQGQKSDDMKYISDTTVQVRAFFRLTKLRIQGSHGTEGWLCCPTPSSSFERLKELEFCDCLSLESLFTVAVAQSLKILQVLKIIKCDRLKHIIRYADGDSEGTFTTDDDEQSVLAFPNLQKLYVEECEELEYLGGHWLLNLFGLNVLSVNCCSSLKSLFTASAVKMMTSLEELRITKCVSLKKVFGVPYSEDSQTIMLPQLKKLTLKELPNLIQVSHGFKLQRVFNVEDGFQSSLQHENPDEITFITDTIDHVRAFFPWITKLTIRSLHSMESLCCGPTPAKSFEKLKELELKDCQSLKSLFTVAVVQNLEMLQILRIINCDKLKHVVWDGDGEAGEEIITTDDGQKRLINLCSLKVLEVKNCSSLKSLFTPSIAKTIISLETLFIERCTSLEKVFGIPYGKDVQALTLPSLKMLRFIELPKLIGVSHGFKLQHAIDAEVDDCPKFRVLVDGYQNLSQVQKSDYMKHINDTTVQIGAFFRLTKLRIQESHGMEGWLCSPTPASSFERLKELEFCKCPSLESLFTVDVAQSLEMLQVLRIIKCDRLEHIISHADEDSNEETFTTDDDQQSVLAFPKLRNLYVEKCGELEYLGGHWLLSLSSLKVLKVRCCSSLNSLFTASTAKTMTSLEELFITRCYSLKEVFGVPYGEDSQALTLPRLKKLELMELPNLIQDFPGFKLHSAIDVVVDGCSQMLYGLDSYISSSLPDETIFFTDTTDHVGAFFPWLTKLKIHRSHSLESLCRGPTPASSFEKLKELEFCECPSLKFLFTIAVAHNLKMLEVMRIIECDKLKDIIWDANANANTEVEINRTDDDQKRTIAFPKLEVLYVHRCENLKYVGRHWILNLCSLEELDVGYCSSLESLFTPSTAKTMMSLEKLIIKKCSSLKNVFGAPYGENDQALTLPGLRMLEFEDLPEFIEVSHGFKLQHVINGVVKDCPKFCGPFDYFKNLLHGKYPELYSGPESEEEEEDAIGQSPARFQERSEVHNALAGTPNIVNTASSSGTANEESTLQTVKEPVQVQEILKIDKNVHGINSRKGEDSKEKKFETPSDAENATKQTTRESVHEPVPISGKYSGGKDSDSQTATNQDVDLNYPLVATNSEYQTPVEERGNQKKTGKMNVIEQSTTQTEIPLSEIITEVGEHLQTEGLHSANNPIGGIDILHEQQIPPIGSLRLKESIGETTMGSAQKSLPSERSTKEISSLELVENASNIEPISMDHQDEAFEENKASTSKKFLDIAMSSPTTQSSFCTANAAISPGIMPTMIELEEEKDVTINFLKQWEDSYQGPRVQGKHEHPLDNVNTEAGSSGKATLELSSSVQEAQNVHIITLASAPIQAPVSSVSYASVHAQTTEAFPMMRSSNEKLMMSLEEEYAAFRDIMEIKKKHIPLLEQAIESYPSLWAWQETHRHPKMKQFGYTMLGDMLEFLASTKWRDLREPKKAEFESLLDGLETLGFDTQWLANTCAQIKQRKTINRIKMLEQQAVALECKLDGIRDELENFNKFIGF